VAAAAQEGIKYEQYVREKEDKYAAALARAVGWSETNISSDDENDLEAIVFEGVEYMMNPSDGSIMDPDDFTVIGVWNAEGGDIDFEGDGEEVNNSKKK